MRWKNWLGCILKAPKIAVLALCLAGFALPSLGQADFLPPEALLKILQSGEARARLHLAEQLRMRFTATPDFSRCEIRLDLLEDAKIRSYLLQVKCGHDANLVVLESAGALSSVAITYYLYDPGNSVRVELASLVTPSRRDIIVHNAPQETGEGNRPYLLVLGMRRGDFQVLMLIPEETVSSFTISPALGTKSGSIDKESWIKMEQCSYRIRRTFAWSEEFQTFFEERAATSPLCVKSPPSDN